MSKVAFIGALGEGNYLGATTGAVFGGALNTLKYSLTASVETAKASLQTADDFLSTIYFTRRDYCSK